MPMPRQEQTAIVKLVSEFPKVTLGDTVLSVGGTFQLDSGEELFIWGIRTDLGSGRNVVGLGKTKKERVVFSSSELPAVKYALLFEQSPEGSVTAKLLEVVSQEAGHTVFRLYCPSVTWHERI